MINVIPRPPVDISTTKIILVERTGYIPAGSFVNLFGGKVLTDPQIRYIFLWKCANAVSTLMIYWWNSSGVSNTVEYWFVGAGAVTTVEVPAKSAMIEARIINNGAVPTGNHTFVTGFKVY